MKKRIAALLLSTVMAFSLTACGNSAKTEKADNKETKQTTEAVEDMSFDEMVDATKGTTVTFYGWGGDDSLNDWLDNYYAPRLKEKYDITLERVPMDIDAILSQLSGEISTDKKDGDIDMIWINGENFKTCKENNMLYGPFAEELPNFQSYIDTDDEETNADFCFPIEGYEAPYGKAQLVMVADTAVTPDLPTNTDEFMEFCKANKGKVTYPALPDFTGSAFAFLKLIVLVVVLPSDLISTEYASSSIPSILYSSSKSFGSPLTVIAVFSDFTDTSATDTSPSNFFATC